MYHRIQSNTFNPQTGDRNQSTDSFKIRKVVWLPANSDKKFVYDLAFISANRNFTEGGFFQRGQASIIIDAKDMPFEPDVESDFVIINKQRYNIKLVDNYQNAAYICQLENVKGEPYYTNVNVSASDSLEITDDVSEA